MQCPHCEHANPGNARYCNQCGQLLQSRAVASYTPRHLQERILAHGSAMQGERKPVTVLFVDIVDSVAASQALGAENWHRVLDRFFSRISAAVHAFDGTVNQYTGDGVMALFGAPIALEQHAEMAARAALRIRTEVQELAADTEQRHGRSLAIRQGLNSGDVVVAAIGDDLRLDYTAKGQTTALAARLEARARPGSILLSGFTARLLGPEFHCESLRALQVKGIEQPVDCLELVGLSETAPVSAVQVVGRDMELSLLQAYARAALEGPGVAVWVSGETGVGKNAVLEAFAAQLAAAEGPRCIRIRGSGHHRAEPGTAVLRLLRALLGSSASDAGPLLATAFSVLLQRWQIALPEAESRLVQWLSAGPDTAIDEDTLRALGEIARALLDSDFVEQPLVFLLHNLQELDNPVGRPLLNLLFSELHRSRWLIVASQRGDWSNPWQATEPSHVLPIRPLSPADSLQWLDTLLGTHASLLPLKEQLIEVSGGYPLHIRDAVRDLQQRGLLEERRRGWVLRQMPTEIPLPDAILAGISARVDALAPARKRLLQVLAVMGERADFQVLATVTDLRDEALRAELAQLERAQLIRSRDQGGAEWVFTRPAIRQVCYRSLLAERRSALHRRIAEVLEQQREVAQSPAILAEHWLAAEQPGRAVGYWLHWAEAGLVSDPQRAQQALDQAAPIVAEETQSQPRHTDLQRALWLLQQDDGLARQMGPRPSPRAAESGSLSLYTVIWLFLGQIPPDDLYATDPAANENGTAAVDRELARSLQQLAMGRIDLAQQSLPEAAELPAEWQGWRDLLAALLSALAGRPYTSWRQAMAIVDGTPQTAAVGLQLCAQLASDWAVLLAPLLESVAEDPAPVLRASVARAPLLHSVHAVLEHWRRHIQVPQTSAEPAPRLESAPPLLRGLAALVDARTALRESNCQQAREYLELAESDLEGLGLLTAPLRLIRAACDTPRGPLSRRFAGVRSRRAEMLRGLRTRCLRIWEPWAMEMLALAHDHQGELMEALEWQRAAAALRREQGWRWP